MGYAFINFSNAIHIVSFFIKFNNQRWRHYNSDKISQITYGRI
jgi:hypothetical protein